MTRSCEFACGRSVAVAYVTLDAPGVPHFACVGCHSQRIREALAGKSYIPQMLPVQTAEVLVELSARREQRMRVWVEPRRAAVTLVG